MKWKWNFLPKRLKGNKILIVGWQSRTPGETLNVKTPSNFVWLSDQIWVQKNQQNSNKKATFLSEKSGIFTNLEDGRGDEGKELRVNRKKFSTPNCLKSFFFTFPTIFRWERVQSMCVRKDLRQIFAIGLHVGLGRICKDLTPTNAIEQATRQKANVTHIGRLKQEQRMQNGAKIERRIIASQKMRDSNCGVKSFDFSLLNFF